MAAQEAAAVRRCGACNQAMLFARGHAVTQAENGTGIRCRICGFLNSPGPRPTPHRLSLKLVRPAEPVTVSKASLLSILPPDPMPGIPMPCDIPLASVPRNLRIAVHSDAQATSRVA